MAPDDASNPTLHVAVRIDRQTRPTRWEEWRFTLADVAIDEGGFGEAMRTLHDDGQTTRWLFPRIPVVLHRDEGEGYHLNLTSGAPVWFVMWRIDDEDPSLARPEAVSLSYNEAGRWLDSQERVDNLPLPAEVRAWLQAYTEAHYRPEPKQRHRPQSFVAPDKR